jgi:hypothetical protein
MDYLRRNYTIERLYRTGQTLAEIGVKENLTRERVRQILRRAGITRDDGGTSVLTQRRVDAVDELMAESGMGLAAAARVLGIPAPKIPEPSVTREERRVIRFWKRVDRSGGSDACWPYTGGRHVCGYGHTSTALPGGSYAHRCAFILTFGITLGRKDVIRHSCDNPPCCNPRHLIRGTQAENLREREERNGGWCRRPKRIQPADVLTLRRSGMTQGAIAETLGCSQPYVCAILRKHPLV